MRLSSLVPLAVLVCASVCATACATPAAPALLAAVPSASPEPSGGLPPRQQPFPPQRARGHAWDPGEPLMHGFFGFSKFQDVEVDGSGGGRIDGDRGDLDEIPVLGGGAQWKMGGERLDYGLEGLLSFGWKGDAEAFVVGGGGAAVAIDVDLLLFELFGGPFLSAPLGDHVRLYGAAGPLLQFADYSQSGALDDDGSGFGVGWYARTGFEFHVGGGTLIGFGARWSDSEVDLGSGLGDLQIEGLQGVLTVSRGI
jgi:hypothetical protein